MARIKKSRKAKGFIDDSGPSRRERLADPDSYDSRRRKALEKKKRHQSVYEKKKAESEEDENSQEQRKTRLADKIRKLNKEKAQQS
ncbi:hypothetical protein [Neptuniibacter marinus]|uniref:hypothetical protein n=1 Tax=Neptuniibacter marinus TaxID=1806670 RepID=UPI0008332DF2|nr:hypothetical protein [Neptuniibacter marinus]